MVLVSIQGNYGSAKSRKVGMSALARACVSHKRGKCHSTVGLVLWISILWYMSKLISQRCMLWRISHLMGLKIYMSFFHKIWSKHSVKREQLMSTKRICILTTIPANVLFQIQVCFVYYVKKNISEAGNPLKWSPRWLRKKSHPKKGWFESIVKCPPRGHDFMVWGVRTLADLSFFGTK